jgi:hypothetical protein
LDPYKEHPQFLGLVLSSGQKQTFGLLATITLEVALFPCICTIPRPSAIF